MEAQVEGVDLLGDAPEWQERALCRGVGSELFFPTKGGSTAPAKRLCEACPVQSECADYAEQTGSGGVWAGKGRTPRYVGVFTSSGRA